MQDPFQTPEASLEPAAALDGSYQPPRTLVIMGLWATLGLTVLALPFELGIVDLQSPTIASVYGGVAVLELVALIFTVVSWSMWIHRAASNAKAVNSVFSYTPGWAVGWYFVPFANLVKPYQTIAEMVALCMPDDFEISEGLLKGWWGCWIASNLVENVSFRLGLSETGGAGAAAVAAVAAVLTIAAGVLAIQMIKQINEGQQLGQRQGLQATSY